MSATWICDAVRTPFGRYGGALAGVRADELGAAPIRALLERNPSVDGKAVDDVIPAKTIATWLALRLSSRACRLSRCGEV